MEFGVPVVIQELGVGDIHDQFKTAGPAGAGPDLIIGAHDWLGELAVNGLLAEIDVSDVADLFLPASLSAFVYKAFSTVRPMPRKMLPSSVTPTWCRRIRKPGMMSAALANS